MKRRKNPRKVTERRKNNPRRVRRRRRVQKKVGAARRTLKIVTVVGDRARHPATATGGTGILGGKAWEFGGDGFFQKRPNLVVFKRSWSFQMSSQLSLNYKSFID